MKYADPAVAVVDTTGFTAAQARAFYPDAITMREARERYFARAGFSATTYVERYIEVPFAGRVVRLPNVKARRDAVRVHDLNHIIGGFGTDWLGEAMAGGFELGMGTGRYWVGWLLNAAVLSMGLARAPRAVVSSFARGRATRASTYRLIPDVTANDYEAVLDGTVGELRARVGAPDDVGVTAGDIVRLTGFTVAGWLVMPLAFALAAGTAVHGLLTSTAADA